MKLICLFGTILFLTITSCNNADKASENINDNSKTENVQSEQDSSDIMSIQDKDTAHLPADSITSN